MPTVASAQWQVALCKSELRVANILKRGQSEAMSALNKARARLRHAINGTSPAPRYDADFETTVDGIPCGVVIVDYTAGCDWRQHTFPGAGPGDCDPPEPPEVQWFVVDSKGYTADWLADRADREHSRIDSEALDHLGL